LLEKSDWYSGELENATVIYQDNFENGTYEGCVSTGIQSENGICVSQEQPFSPLIIVSDISKTCGKWVRTQANIYTPEKEWETWKMAQMGVKFYKGENLVKENVIRLHRIMNHGETRAVYIDSNVGEVQFDEIRIQFWNPGSHRTVIIDDLEVFCF
jgi:hypothetical protein